MKTGVPPEHAAQDSASQAERLVHGSEDNSSIRSLSGKTRENLSSQEILDRWNTLGYLLRGGSFPTQGRELLKELRAF
jgi:hypothetical protein